MRHLCSTQAFAQFVMERVERDPSDFEVLFFDEQIKKKMNRMSLSRLGRSSSRVRRLLYASRLTFIPSE